MSSREVKEKAREAKLGMNDGHFVSNSDKWDTTRIAKGPLGTNLREHSQSPSLRKDQELLNNLLKKSGGGGSSGSLSSRSSRDNLSNSDHGSYITASGGWKDPLNLSDHNRKTGEWMQMNNYNDELNNSNHSKNSLDWSNHSDSSASRIIQKRYADAGKTDSKSRFKTEANTQFKSHKTTPSGRKL